MSKSTTTPTAPPTRTAPTAVEHDTPAATAPRDTTTHPTSSATVRTALKLMRFIIAPRKARFAAAVCCMVVCAVVIALNSFYTKYLIDHIITPLVTAHATRPNFAQLTQAATGMGILCLLGVAGNFGYSRLMAIMSHDVQFDLRNQMFSRLQSLPVRYFDTHPSGDVMSHYTNDIDTMDQMITQSIPQVLTSVLTMLAVLSAMCLISLPMTVIILAVFFLDTQIVRIIGGRAARSFNEQQRKLATLNGFVEEAIQGQKVIKVFTHEAQSTADFDQLNGHLQAAADKANRYANILMPIIGNIGHLQYVLTFVIGAALIFAGAVTVTIGTIGAFLQLGRVFSNNLGQIVQQFNFIVTALAGADRIFAHLEEEPEQDSGTIRLINTKEAAGECVQSSNRTGSWAWLDEKGTLIPLHGALSLTNVSFGYFPNKEILHDVSFYAKPGQKIALIGATGAGKTTITNLINRFYDIDAGSIAYDGIDISCIRKNDLRRSLGIVLQDTSLFTGTVTDNIRYGRLEASDDEVIAAAKLANAHEFVTGLAHGYDTVLSGNSEDLSQGQRQLLAIARAALSDPPVMVLDEATSSIDTRTELLVQAGMDALMKGRTVLVIAHRLSTIQNADVIMVMDHGRIIERGNHDQLMAQKGRYYYLNSTTL